MNKKSVVVGFRSHSRSYWLPNLKCNLPWMPLTHSMSMFVCLVGRFKHHRSYHYGTHLYWVSNITPLHTIYWPEQSTPRWIWTQGLHALEQSNCITQDSLQNFVITQLACYILSSALVGFAMLIGQTLCRYKPLFVIDNQLSNVRIPIQAWDLIDRLLILLQL